jgi:hypothetical protein
MKIIMSIIVTTTALRLAVLPLKPLRSGQGRLDRINEAGDRRDHGNVIHHVIFI